MMSIYSTCRMNRASVFIVLVGIVAAGSSPARGQCLRWSTAFENVGPADDVNALEVFDDGSGPALFVGGHFPQYIVRWDGASWSTVGTGIHGVNHPLSGVYALTTYPAPAMGGPYLVAGGTFTTAGSVTAYGIAKWNGTTWSAFPGGGLPNDNSRIEAMVADGNILYVGGSFGGISGVPANNVAMWNGSQWFPLGTGTDGQSHQVFALELYDDGTGLALYAGGNFDTADGITVNGVAKWNGSGWETVGSPPGVNGTVYAMTTFDDGTGLALYVGGSFISAGSVPAEGVARWDGSNWSMLGTGTSSAVFSLTSFDDGNGPALYAGGAFETYPGLRIAKWDGADWSELGEGITAASDGVVALAGFESLSGGRELYAGGGFSRVGAIQSRRIAAWRACDSPIETFCFGDGTVAACPCSNQGIYGHGCENSLANGGARLYTSGSTSPDTLVLHSAGELPNALSIFLQGDALISSTVDFGDGLRCAGGNLKRLYVKNATSGQAAAPSSGELPINRRSLELGDPLGPGSTRYYQTYYRDPSASFCSAPTGSTFNATNGVRVVW